jgi:hypothetical protein
MPLLLVLLLLCGCEKEEIKHALENEKVHTLTENVIDIGEDVIEDLSGLKVDVKLPGDEDEKK